MKEYLYGYYLKNEQDDGIMKHNQRKNRLF